MQKYVTMTADIKLTCP